VATLQVKVKVYAEGQVYSAKDAIKTESGLTLFTAVKTDDVLGNIHPEVIPEVIVGKNYVVEYHAKAWEVKVSE